MIGEDSDDATPRNVLRVNAKTPGPTRPRLRVFPTAYPPVPEIVLYASTNELHIRSDRKTPDAEKRFAEALASQSTVVVKGTSTESYVAFVNPAETSPMKAMGVPEG